MHTDGVHAKVVTCETVELREFTAMKRANVEKILSTLPYFFLKVSALPRGNQDRGRGSYELNDQTFWVATHFENAARRPEWNVLSP